jgi:hypothetical protein
MAAHRHSTNSGWWDTPVHPALGVALFLTGFVAIWLFVLVAGVEVFGR